MQNLFIPIIFTQNRRFGHDATSHGSGNFIVGDQKISHLGSEDSGRVPVSGDTDTINVIVRDGSIVTVTKLKNAIVT